MREYEIITKTVTPGYYDENGKFIKTGDPKEKTNIIYYDHKDDEGTMEHFGENAVIRPGYTQRITNQ